MPTPTSKPSTNGRMPDDKRWQWCCTNGSGFVRKILLTLVTVLLVYVIFYVGTLIRNEAKQYHYIGRADKMERTVTVNGTGKVSGKNDIAVTTLGYNNVDKDVAVAQANNKRVMDAIMNELQRLGIEEKDLRTNYTVGPDYQYTPEKGQELKGYRVSNSVTIKIRDLTKIPNVLSLAGKYGANEVGGLDFTIDDPENLKQQARQKALEDAVLKARYLSQSLGVKIAGVVAYNEYDGGDTPPIYYDKAALTEGMGGGMGPATVAGGSRDVTMSVSITYEIVPWKGYR